MAWASRTTETVNSGSDSARVDLLPGEWAHVQVEHTSGTDRMRVQVYATNEDTPGVVDIDSVPLLEFRIEAAASVSFIISDVHAFVVSIDNDVDADALTASVRVRKSAVDLTA